MIVSQLFIVCAGVSRLLISVLLLLFVELTVFGLTDPDSTTIGNQRSPITGATPDRLPFSSLLPRVLSNVPGAQRDERLADLTQSSAQNAHMNCRNSHTAERPRC